MVRKRTVFVSQGSSLRREIKALNDIGDDKSKMQELLIEMANQSDNPDMLKAIQEAASHIEAIRSLKNKETKAADAYDAIKDRSRNPSGSGKPFEA